MASGIKAIIFDKDGTLFNYGKVWGTVISASLKAKVPVEGLSKEKAEACILELEKITGIDRYGNAHKDGILFRHDKLIECTVRLLKVIFKYKLPPIRAISAFLSLVESADHGLKERLENFDFSETTEILERCHERGYTIGMVTNDKKDSVQMFLEKFDPNRRISFIETGDGNSKRKPSADAARKFMKLNSIKPSELCIIGDTIIDMKFARNAKAGRKIALLSGSGDLENLTKLSDVVYPNIKDIINDPVLF